ncbi:hypothetical protein GUITHDRAFT_102838 [Guillardia theta CCMP2712]|uniref:Uncharacterized protein n=1 Tax=Guillardia theta (strain CCMP2712) TaxID=905079 RepID=L1JTP4_GUITC|nr:hypothetical protein GUITHDRAFT_102838 [Guillardia theta CCMP2712]EKX51575.1 hypothetical protein GUITHDRAFT_102838 [Guillardia theta CCMP2712]|eukprot:XP_005838555.1 hypothetical protein GUITHDRAFT_102838 [Guillardia theta CCMP2712]
MSTSPSLAPQQPTTSDSATTSPVINRAAYQTSSLIPGGMVYPGGYMLSGNVGTSDVTTTTGLTGMTYGSLPMGYSTAYTSLAARPVTQVTSLPVQSVVSAPKVHTVTESQQVEQTVPKYEYETRPIIVPTLVPVEKTIMETKLVQVQVPKIITTQELQNETRYIQIPRPVFEEKRIKVKRPTVVYEEHEIVTTQQAFETRSVSIPVTRTYTTTEQVVTGTTPTVQTASYTTGAYQTGTAYQTGATYQTTGTGYTGYTTGSYMSGYPYSTGSVTGTTGATGMTGSVGQWQTLDGQPLPAALLSQLSSGLYSTNASNTGASPAAPASGETKP